MVALGYRRAACAIYGERVGHLRIRYGRLDRGWSDLGLTHTGRKWVVGLTPGTRFLCTPIGGLRDLLGCDPTSAFCGQGDAC